jgi:hypothetical protein
MVASMVIGGVWYDKHVLGTVWARLAGIKTDQKVSGAEMAKLMGTQILASLVTAFVLAHFVWYTHAFNKGGWVTDALQCAFWAWLGFTACRLVMHDMFEGRRKKLSLLNIAYELVTLLAMGAIIGWLHP